MQKSLTWQQTACILLAIVIFVFVVMRFGGDISDEARQVGLYGLAVTVPLFVLVLVSHFRRVRKSDIYPDLLATIVPVQSIMQAGQCHFHIESGCLANGEIMIGVLAQNLLDAEGTLQLRFKSSVRSVDVPALHCVLPPAGIVRATMRFMTEATEKPYQFRLALLADHKGKGMAIRFGRRGTVTRRVNPAVTTIALLGGVVYAGGGTYLTLQVPAHSVPPELRQAPPASWELEEIWSAEDWPDVDVFRARLTGAATTETPATA